MELLYQDSQIVLCVKPAGLSSEAGAGSLPELLEDQLGRPVFPVHRLDRNVGGVMVYARTRQAASALSRAVQAGNLQKEYLALIHGCPTQPAGTWEDLLWKDSAKNKVFVVRQMRKGVKAAKLAYRVLEEATPLTLVHIRSPALWSFRLTLPHPATGETITCLHPPEGELWHMFPMISREIPRW